MNTCLMLVCLLATACLVLADPLQTIYTTIDLKKLGTVTRVTKLQEITFPYTLRNDAANVWTEFPSLNIAFSLPSSQFVQISYSTVLNTNGNNFFITRVLVDRVQNRLFRYITGATHFHTNTVSMQVWLEKGNHQVQVQYRSEGTFPTIFSDWPEAFIKVDYYDIS